MRFFCYRIFALLAFILCLPVLAIAVVVIVVADRQNPIFIQDRVGKNMRSFHLIKLRTMKEHKATFIGNILRKTGIDELPQLMHIVQGKMSFVGPRPLLFSDIDRLGWNDDYHQIRWTVFPGMTGLAQLSPVCHKRMSWALDCLYLKRHNFWLDCQIILASAGILFLGKKRIINWFHTSRNNERTR